MCRGKRRTVSAEIGNGTGLFTARMKFVNHLAQVIAIKMGIYFRSGDGFMTEHFLNRPQVGAAFDQMRGERMPEGVRTNRLFQPHLFCQVSDNGKNHHTGELPAVTI